MKILFIEDTASWINEFKPLLETFGEVVHFKSSNAARRWMAENKFDLVVCDHNILRFETESRSAYGTEVYHELRFTEETETTPFIHFSYEPCPEDYSTTDPHFYSLRKDTGAKLGDLITKITKIISK